MVPDVTTDLDRRSVLAGVAAGTAALAGCGTRAGTPTPGTDDTTAWPFPAADAAGTAYVSDAAAPRTDVTGRWSRGLRARPTDRPVVAEGLVLVPTASELLAYDVASGERVWRYAPPPDAPVFHAPAVRDGLVYATFREEGGAVALDPADGSVRWRGDVGEPASPPLPMLDGDARRVLVGETSGRLRLLDGLGEPVWRYGLFGPVTHLRGRGELPVVHAGTEAGEVYALYERDDEPVGLWRRKLGGKIESMAVDDGGDVFTSTFGGKLRRLAGGAHAGSDRWVNEAGGTSTGGLVIARDVYGLNLAGFVAVDTRTGGTDWQVRSGGAYDFTAGPAAAGDTVYAGREDAVVAFPLDGGGPLALGGRKRFSYGLESPPTAGLAVADGAVFAVTQGEKNVPPRLHALQEP
jgi:outer membrane protein assembly factor BamB